MKKSLFFVAAVSALMLTACSSENDVVQSAPQTQEAAAQPVGFDVYLPQAVTRAGSPTGVMTTDKLKTENEGFGVFAMYTGTAAYTATPLLPNFMFNEHLHWTEGGGWTYSPLKYWPNETTKDSQKPTAATMPELEKVSFFAYAPYVSAGSAVGNTLTTEDNTHMVKTYTGSPATTPATYYDKAWSGSETSGILSISAQDRTGDPLVEWAATTDLDKNVDLLWGVAPKGMDYTAVNGENVPTYFGFPLLDLVKPNKDQKIKFLFQHALSRMSINVVSAIDQIAAGDDGGKFDPNQTRVLIEEVKIFGDFSMRGVLNLNNYGGVANVANWEQASILKSTSVVGTPLITLDQGTANGYLSPDLRYIAADITAINSDASKFANLNRGVLPSESVLLSGDADPSKLVKDGSGVAITPTYEYGTSYYVKQDGASNKSYVVAKAITAPTTSKVYYQDASGNFTQVYNGSGSGFGMDGSTKYYTLTGDDAASSAAITSGSNYWTKDGDNFIVHAAAADRSLDGSTEYLLSPTEITAISATKAVYASGSYYTGLIPRYFMFAPSKDGEPTNIGVQITYRVITKDTKLDGNVSNIQNIVTKTIPLTMESGKSYNLKLILGLTTVKLDATVGEWQVGDDAEVWLPQNVQ